MDNILDSKDFFKINKFINMSAIPDKNIFIKKTLIIAYGGILQFFVTLFIAKQINSYIAKPYDENACTKKNLLNLLIIISSMLISHYWVRKFMTIMPYPMHDAATFDVYKIKEIRGSVVTAFAYILFLGDVLNSYKPFIENIYH